MKNYHDYIRYIFILPALLIALAFFYYCTLRLPNISKIKNLVPYEPGDSLIFENYFGDSTVMVIKSSKQVKYAIYVTDSLNTNSFKVKGPFFFDTVSPELLVTARTDQPRHYERKRILTSGIFKYRETVSGELFWNINFPLKHLEIRKSGLFDSMKTPVKLSDLKYASNNRKYFKIKHSRGDYSSTGKWMLWNDSLGVIKVYQGFDNYWELKRFARDRKDLIL